MWHNQTGRDPLLPALTSSRKIAAAAALAASMLALAACGGGDDTATTDSTQGTPLTEADFTSQANAICTAGNEEVDSAAADLGQQPSQADIESFAKDTLVPSIQDQINAIAALGAPEGQTEQVDTFLEDAAAEHGARRIVFVVAGTGSDRLIESLGARLPVPVHRVAAGA